MAVLPVSAAVTASGPTITLPSHSTGDLIVIVATKGGSGTIPSLPAGWTSAFTASAADSVRVGYKVAASGAETSGTWTNAEDLAAGVYSGADQVGAVAWATTTGLPALTLDVTSGSSWVMAATWDATTPATPSSMTSRATGTFARVADTNAGVASWSAQGAYAMDFGAVVEIRETAIDLVPADLASAGTLDAVAVTQVHNVTVADLTAAAALDVAEHATTWTGWAGFIGSTEYATAVAAKSRTVGAWVEMVDTSGTSRATLSVESATVDFRGEADEQWACEITSRDPDLTPTSATDLLDPRSGLRARVWWRLRYRNAWNVPTWGDVPVGTYHLEDPRITDTEAGFGITVTGRDSLVIAKRGGYGGAVLDVSGLTVTDALALLFERVCPSLPVRIAQTTQTVPGAEGSGTVQLGLGDTTPADDWRALADSAGWVVRTDRLGTIVAGPPPSPRTIKASWQEGPDCPVSMVSRDVTNSRIRNRVVVRSTVRDLTEPVWAVKEDTDESSPTWVGGVFGVREAEIASDAVDTAAACLAMARMHYGRLNHPTETVSVQVPQRGDLDYRDRVNLRRDRAGVGGTFLVSSWTLRMVAPDQAPQPMGVTMMTRAVDES